MNMYKNKNKNNWSMRKRISDVYLGGGGSSLGDYHSLPSASEVMSVSDMSIDIGDSEGEGESGVGGGVGEDGGIVRSGGGVGREGQEGTKKEGHREGRIEGQIGGEIDDCDTDTESDTTTGESLNKSNSKSTLNSNSTSSSNLKLLKSSGIVRQSSAVSNLKLDIEMTSRGQIVKKMMVEKESRQDINCEKNRMFDGEMEEDVDNDDNDVENNW